MPATNKNSVVESRLAELRAELSDVNETLRRIDEAIATLQRQAEADPEFAQDAEYLDRMTVEGGRKRIMDRRKSEIEAEISRLESAKAL
jgi:hypothetical protein